MRSARLLALVLLLAVGGSAASTSYTLRRGDTLSGVAAKFRIPIAAITAANDIPDPDFVRAGEKLAIPDRKSAMVAAAKPIASAAEPAPADGSKLYEVQSGDTLSGIAKRFDTTVSDLVTRNGLTSADAIIREGKPLKLPGSADVPAPEAPLCPVRGADKWAFSNSFGAPREGHRHHGGNDIFAKRGTAVLAGVDGRIRVASGSRAGLAYYLDGVDGVTYYGAHMDALRVESGQFVKRGEALGTVGTTGNAHGTPPHLHFEVKPGGGSSIDPYALLRTWCQ